jgi:hypothetical protein
MPPGHLKPAQTDLLDRIDRTQARSVTIKVCKFGLLDPAKGWDKRAIYVLFLRNRLWNSLVSLECELRQAYRKLMLAADTDLATLQKRLDSIEAEPGRLFTHKNAGRAKARSRGAGTHDIDRDLEDLIEERKILREQGKILRERVKIHATPAP